MRNAIQQMGRQNRQISEKVGKAGLRRAKSQDHRGVVGGAHRGELRQIVHPWVAGIGIACGVEGPGHIARSGGLSVMPADRGLEMKGEPGAIR